MSNQVDLIQTSAVPALVDAGTQATAAPGEGYFPNTVKLMNGKYNGRAFGSNFVVPGVEGVDYPTLDGGYIYYFDSLGKIVQSTVTTVGVLNIIVTHQMVWNGTAPLSAADITALELNPNLIMDVWFDAEVLPSGYAKTDIGNFFPGNCVGDTIQDLSRDIENGGPEQILNGTLDTDLSDWTNLDNWWEWDASGRAYCPNNTDSGVRLDSSSFESDKTYLISLDVEVVSGGLKMTDSGNQFIEEIFTESGHYEYTAYSPPGGDRFLRFIRNFTQGNFDGYLDNVSAKEDVPGAAEGADIGTGSRLTNQLIGMNSLLIRQDATGRSLSTMPSGQIAVDASGKNVDTDWTVTGSRWSIEQTVSGNLADLDGSGDPLGTFSQRTEARVISHDEINGDKYYINAVSHPVPALPTGKLIANETAFIGYPDTVDTHHGDLVVHSDVIIP